MDLDRPDFRIMFLPLGFGVQMSIDPEKKLKKMMLKSLNYNTKEMYERIQDLDSSETFF